MSLPVENLRLRPVRDEDESSMRAADVELATDGFDFSLGLAAGLGWAAYRQATIDAHLGRNLPDGFVPASFLVGVLDGALVGRVSVRHRLNDFLLSEGGHIGYGVRPAYRRRGVATRLLRLSLIVARAHDVDRVLVTCDPDNVGSATVIERCGGRLDASRPVSDGPGPPKRRYWID
jgi:predicted acetyltransferase